MVPSDEAFGSTGVRPSWKKGMAKGALFRSSASPSNEDPSAPSKTPV